MICPRRSSRSHIHIASARVRVEEGFVVRVELALLFAACACSGAQESGKLPGCGKDTDCKDPRVCERGVCVDPHPAGAAVASSDAGGDAPVAVKGAPAFAMFGGDARHTG